MVQGSEQVAPVTYQVVLEPGIGSLSTNECILVKFRWEFFLCTNSLAERARRSFFFFLTLLLSSSWTSRGHRCRPFSPPVLAFNFYRAQGPVIPLLDDFSSSIANSRSRAFRKSICAQEKVPTNLYTYALRGARTHETDLYQARR